MTVHFMCNIIGSLRRANNPEATMKPMVAAMHIFVFFLTTFSLFAANDKFSIGSYNVENLWDLDAGNTPGAWRAYLASLPDQRRAEMGHRRLQ